MKTYFNYTTISLSTILQLHKHFQVPINMMGTLRKLLFDALKREEYSLKRKKFIYGRKLENNQSKHI